MKRNILLITTGLFNLIHAFTHVIQFVQSLFLFKLSVSEHEEHSFLDELLHNPYLSLIWATIGIVSLVVGIKDMIHHKKCSH